MLAGSSPTSYGMLILYKYTTQLDDKSKILRRNLQASGNCTGKRAGRLIPANNQTAYWMSPAISKAQRAAYDEPLTAVYC
jgi:hypothetical protein